MRRKGDLPELLSPAGDFEALVAAVAAGADAVYVGGKAFSARAYAKNFDADELSMAVRYCHLFGVKLYVTVNTLVYDKELDELVEYAKTLWRIGVDALIVADLGAIRRIREALPDLPLHASTQTALHNSQGVALAAELGCTRAVPARECSLENIKRMVEDSPLEIEVFLHGALCVCHSGQCLFSSLVGGRSGNRGECAQPCRLPYGEGYPLSLCDLSLSHHIGELIASGVSSLKIEGRMKSPDYVYRVTSIYRRLLDEHREARKEEDRALAAAFSRGGFTDGYFTGHPEKKMTGIRSDADKSATRAQEELHFEPKKRKVAARVTIEAGKPAEMTIFDEEKTVTVTGETPAPARNAPLTAPDVKARLSKTGNTFLSLDAEEISLSLGEGLNLSPGALNALRRAATDAFENCEREPVSAPPCRENGGISTEKTRRGAADEPCRSALFFHAEMPQRVADAISDFDLVFVPLMSLPEGELSPINGVYLPPVVFDGEAEEVRTALAAAKARGIRYALVGGLGGIALAKEAGLHPVGDFRLNIMNGETLAAYRALGVGRAILSVELTLPMARDIARAGKASVAVAGRIPLMLTERCFMKENFGCEKCSRVSLTDRRGQKFPMLREYPHRNLILNSQPTYMGDKKNELLSAGIRGEHFLFTVENEREVRKLLSAYRAGQPLDQPVRRLGKREKE